MPGGPLDASRGLPDSGLGATGGILESPSRDPTAPHPRDKDDFRNTHHSSAEEVSLVRFVQRKTPVARRFSFLASRKVLRIELPCYPVYMRVDKKAATTMRREGKSYSEILKALKVPKATLSGWFGKANWSREVRKKLTAQATVASTERIRNLDRIRGRHLKRVYAEARDEARKEFAELKYNPLFIAGLMLYWGEGDKRTRGQVRLCNTDPELVRLFVFFLKNACQIPDEKIKGSVLIYPDLDPDTCVDYWSAKSGIAKNNFHACVTIQGRHKKRKLLHGVGNAMVLSTYFKEKILEWIRLLPHELMGKKYYESM